MSRAKLALVMSLLAILGLWGCAKEGPRRDSSTARIKALEANYANLESKNTNLEKELQKAGEERDQTLRKLATLEKERKALLDSQKSEVQALRRQRDEMRQELQARTTERDSVQSKCDKMAKIFENLENLIGQGKAVMTSGSTNPLTATAKPSDNGL